jgi:hypothetical protein
MWLLCLEKHFYAQSGVFVPLVARRGEVSLKRESAKPSPTGDATSAALDKSLRRWRRLRELARGWAGGVLPHRDSVILKALIRTETLTSPWRIRFLTLSNFAQLGKLLEDAESAVTASIADHRQHRRDRWHNWCNDPIQAARVYRYIRQGPTPVSFPPVGAGRSQPGKATQLAEVDAWWWKLWAPEARELHTDRWLPALDRLPPFPAIERLTGVALWGVIKSTPASKAPGRDGWSYLDLKRLPIEALDLLSLIFHAVEATGEWPEPIAHSFVAMLPKGGTGKVDDYRPIVLLSVFYRLWAKARGSPFQRFLKAAGITPPSGPRAADALAYDLALRMAASIAGYPPTSGLALDWSKCYDHLILDLLETVGRRVQIPPALLGPMLAAYRQPRAVLLAGALGKERRPTAGLAPGCPRATDLLAIVVYMYTAGMTDVHPGIVSRPYVDDITSDITDVSVEVAVEVVSEMVAFTSRFAEDLAFFPNQVKSRRFSTDPVIRTELRKLAGPVVASSFLDLGVAQTPVNRPSALQGKRHLGP